MPNGNKSSKKQTIIYPNLDLYPTSKDVDISFYQELYKYKSVADYLKNKKKKKKKRSQRRKNAFITISEDIMTSIPYSPETSGMNQFGMTSHITPSSSFFNETTDNLNYAINKDKEISMEEKDEEIPISNLMESLYGDQNSISPIEDEYNIYERLNDLGRRDPVYTGILDGAPNPIQKY